MKKYQWVMKTWASSIILGLICIFAHASERATRTTINHALQKSPDTTDVFLTASNLTNINATALKSQLRQQFLNYYFSPWDQPFIFGNLADLRELAELSLISYKNDPGWLENRQRNTGTAILQLGANMNLAAYPNLKMRAITVRETNLRALPTNKPIFGDWHLAGQGYPFDNMQISRLSANLPLYVLHMSKDGAWLLVSTPEEDLGWVNSLNVAAVNAEFIAHWHRRSQQFVVVDKDGAPLFDYQQRFYLASRIGELFPLVAISVNSYLVNLAVRDINGQAQIKTVRLNKAAGQLFPSAFTPDNIAKMINTMLSVPYGWGDLYGYRDCSATMRDLFAVFALWLPRNSGEQAHQGHFINLQGLSRTKKMSMIQQQGKPFYTLLSTPGHIMLYVGQYQQESWVFHSPWALHTAKRHSGKGGRAIIGRSVITPLNFGSHYANVKQSLLDKVTGMTILLPLKSPLPPFKKGGVGGI